MFTIVKNSKPLSYTNYMCKYVIAFNDFKMANIVKENLKSHPHVDLMRTEYRNVSSQLKEHLKMEGVPISGISKNVYIDNHAMLTLYRTAFDLPRYYNSELKEESNNEYKITSENIYDILKYPFQEGTGIILPYNISHNDLYKTVLICDIIEASSIEYYN